MSQRGSVVSQFIYDNEFAQGLAKIIQDYTYEDMYFGDIQVNNRVISGRVIWHSIDIPYWMFFNLIDQIEAYSDDNDEVTPLILIIDETGLKGENRVFALRRGQVDARFADIGQMVEFNNGWVDE